MSNGEGAVLNADQPSRVIARDIQLVARARREGWLKDPEDKQRVAQRVVKIALENPDEEIALKAAAELRQMVAQDSKTDNDSPPILHHHTHTHELEPVTAENIDQQRAARIARYAKPSQS